MYFRYSVHERRVCRFPQQLLSLFRSPMNFWSVPQYLNDLQSLETSLNHERILQKYICMRSSTTRTSQHSACSEPGL